MTALSHSDARHLLAAQGWLELGLHLEADRELDEITPALRVHPDVLELRWQIYDHAEKWCACVDIAQAITKLAPNRPFGWIHLSFSLHALKRTQEAWDNLIAVVDRFPKESLMRYNLACYATQLGNLNDAILWLHRAFDIAENPKELKLMALDDPDLQPLRKEYGVL